MPKEYIPTPPRRITWKDIEEIYEIGEDAKKSLLLYFSKISKGVRLLIWQMWREAWQSIEESTENNPTDRENMKRLRRNRDEYNDRVLLSACRIVQARDYTRAQEHAIRAANAKAEQKRREKWRKSKKQKILRQYDLIQELYNKYGHWGEVMKAIRRKPKTGEPDPFYELRGEKEITPKYLASIMAEEAKKRGDCLRNR